MTVNEIPVNIRCLEYQQDKEDKDYGSCLYARFYFNLDKYELNIVSDCGNYGYQWCATPETESFLHLMARVSDNYLLGKLCGEPKEFDYDATKEDLYDTYKDDEEATGVLDRIFEEIELDGEPYSADEFIIRFDEENYLEDSRHAYFSDTWEFPVMVYTAWQKRIVRVFDECIQPKIREILKEEGE